MPEHGYPIVDEVKLDLPPRPEPPRRRLRPNERPVPPAAGDPCPACNEADLVQRGGKHACPQCWFVSPCCETQAPAR